MMTLIFSCGALAKATKHIPFSATFSARALAWSPLDSRECKRDKSSDCWGKGREMDARQQNSNETVT